MSPDPGTDLTLSTAGRTWINCDGEKNFPDGEVFSAPVEDSVNGIVRFSYPAVLSGREVSGIELTFEHGRVVKATAEKGEDLLLSQLDTDDGARVLGEFAFGTNFDIQRFSKNILFDEKDRRNDPYGSRCDLSGIRRNESIGDPLGYGLRPPRRWQGHG